MSSQTDINSMILIKRNTLIRWTSYKVLKTTISLQNSLKGWWKDKLQTSGKYHKGQVYIEHWENSQNSTIKKKKIQSQNEQKPGRDILPTRISIY